MSSSSPRAPSQIEKLVNLIPVALKEAALDSPSFRASVVHFSEQIDTVEKWLNGYVKTSSKLASELLALDSFTNSYLSHLSAPVYLSESLVDPDYTALALKRYSDVTCDYWVGVISTVRNIDRMVVEPIRKFLHNDIKHIKELQRTVEQNQKQFDHLHSKYSSIARTKEPSSLREDAFQMHEARKAYLKSALDFALLTSQIKSSLDRLLVNVCFDQWRSFKQLRDTSSAQFAQASKEMERIKGWSHELTTTEKTSKNEILAARRQIEESTEYALRPSRELEDYSVSTVAYVNNSRGPSAAVTKGCAFGPEKQGWLNLRVLVGKPTRTQWVRRWLFLKNGTFGCLVQGARLGGVEESERIGVLLCGVRPAFTEERRFCFEVKTNNNSIMLQAETQKDLTEWIGTFEAAKRKALESPSPETPQSPSERANGLSKDLAFIISQPPAAEFAADPSVSLSSCTHVDNSERTSTSQDRDLSGPSNEFNFDKITPRKTSQFERETRESDHARDHAIRLIQKLDPSYRKGSTSKVTPTHQPSIFPTTHGSSDADPLAHKPAEPASSFAPSTLVSPPAPTNLSREVVFIGGERGIGQRLCGGTGSSQKLPAGMMANLWGSYYWGIGNVVRRSRAAPSSPTAETIFDKDARSIRSGSFSPSAPGHRQTKSLSASLKMNFNEEAPSKYEYPDFYPTALRTQDVQFRLLFPDVPREEQLLLVYRATFSPNDNQDFPGRIYVTTQNIYFYSNHLGLVCTSCAPFTSISEITGAPGRDCDFLYMHMVPPLGSDEPGRVTIKTYLEPLKLTQQRLNYLLEASCSEEPPTLRTIFKTLQSMEDETLKSGGKGPDSNVNILPPARNENVIGAPGEHSDDTKNIVLGTRIDKAMDVDLNKETLYFRLPTRPVEYTPEDVHHLALERKFEISTKAMYHLLFGDRSPLWRYLLYQRGARDIHQGPWQTFKSNRITRDITFKANALSTFGTPERVEGFDYQVVDFMNDHLCYVVTDKQTPWHLPFRNSFQLVTKVVVTHVAKSRSKLAIYTEVDWQWRPYLLGNVIEKLAMDDLTKSSKAILDHVHDQLRKPEVQGLSTKRALTLFGQVGLEPDGITLSGEIPGLAQKYPREQMSLGTITWITSLAFAQQVASMLFSVIQEVLGWCGRTLHAHHVLVLVLLVSAIFNGLHVSRDVSVWWSERRANKFFNALAIRPSRVVSKAVYLKDLDAAVVNTTFQKNINASSCFSVFHDHNVLGSADDLLVESSLLPSRNSRRSRNSSDKLMRTRQRLGIYRHELLVALRVINSVEKELIGAEWERWLRLENNKCRAIKRLLDENEKHDASAAPTGKPGGGINGGTSSEVAEDEASVSGADSSERDARGDGILSLAMERFTHRGDDVEKWYQEYCLSCYEEQNRLRHKSLTAGFASARS